MRNPGGILGIAAAAIIAAGLTLAHGTSSDNHHEVIEVPTPREGVVCYALLNDKRRPTALSCVYTGGRNESASHRADVAQGVFRY